MRKNIILLILSLIFSGIINGKTRKAVFIIADGIPADQIERLKPPAIFDISERGAYSRAYMGGEIGGYSQTATISAICYTSLLTSTWVNKHNVTGNENLDPNYNYWTLFRIAKEQSKDVKTGLYSSWIDNRTVLLGEGKPETNNLKIDFVKDGYDIDKSGFPKKEKNLQIFDIDELVSKEAAKGIREDAPDLSWVYLWYTDDAGHRAGNSAFFDEYVMKADKQVGRIWDAVKYREENFDEEWMIIVTTDHGRTENGRGHGGQSLRERTIWISTNKKVNEYFNINELAITDIAPSISKFLNFEVPKEVLWEQDGKSFYGEADIYNIRTEPYDNFVYLGWDTFNENVPVTIYLSADNKFKKGENDKWIKVTTVKANQKSYKLDLNDYPESKFYKFVLETPNNHMNRWLLK